MTDRDAVCSLAVKGWSSDQHHWHGLESLLEIQNLTQQNVLRSIHVVRSHQTSLNFNGLSRRFVCTSKQERSWNSMNWLSLRWPHELMSCHVNAWLLLEVPNPINQPFSKMLHIRLIKKTFKKYIDVICLWLDTNICILTIFLVNFTD